MIFEARQVGIRNGIGNGACAVRRLTTKPGQTTLTPPLAGALHVLILADPDAGDRLFVVPAKPGKGVLTPKRFVEMEALPTAVGIGIVPFSDDLSVEVQNELVTVSRLMP